MLIIHDRETKKKIRVSDGNRTNDLQNTEQALYSLSYGETRLEDGKF